MPMPMKILTVLIDSLPTSIKSMEKSTNFITQLLPGLLTVSMLKTKHGQLPTMIQFHMLTQIILIGQDSTHQDPMQRNSLEMVNIISKLLLR